MRSWGRLPAVVVLAVGGVAMGCGADDGGSEASSRGRASGDAAGEGAPLMEGLVAPAGTRLVGTVFELPWGEEDADVSSVAVLTVDGDPFAAWDDLAGQVRELGAPLPRSGICTWLQPSRSGTPPPVRTVVEAAPEGTEGVSCEGSGTPGNPHGGAVAFYADLWVSPDGAELGIQASPAAPGDEPRSYPEADPGPAPAGAADDLPPIEQPSPPEVGEPFGRENNCFEAGYRRFVVPEGAEVVGGGNAPVIDDFAAVLAVDDARAVLDDLGEQLDSTGPEVGDATVTIERATVPGGQVWQLTGNVSAGGGACGIWSTPDGKLLLVTTHSD